MKTKTLPALASCLLLSACADQPVEAGDRAVAAVAFAGDDQVQFPGLRLKSSLAVAAVNDIGEPAGVSGLAVAWVVLEGGGSIEVVSDTTDGVGIARARLTLGSETGSNRAQATVQGFPAVEFNARSVDPGPIVFVSSRIAGFPGDPVAGFPGDLHVMNEDGSDVVPLLPGSRPVDFVADPAWSPDGRKILFARSEPRPAGGTPGAVPLGLFLTPPNGVSDEQLPLSGTPPFVDFLHEPSWSPRGDSAVARHMSDGTLYVFPKNGSNFTLLTNRAAFSPAWSSAGGSIAFACLSGSSVHICTVGTDGGGLRQLTNGTVVDGDPSWSPDGTMILFSRDSLTAGGLWLIRSDGSDLAQVLTGVVTSSAWSPDGTQFLATIHDGNGSDIFRGDIATGDAVNLTQSPHLDRQPSWRR
jgi:dipeptidyl aminopeptidase/acylaminoacyl peptidase